MFTGIIQAVGTVTSVDEARTSRDPGRCLGLVPPGLAGDSIAVDGCCLTVTEDDRSSPAGGRCVSTWCTRRCGRPCSGGAGPGDAVNLEHAVTPSTMLSGHIVQGHIDGVGEVVDVTSGDDEWRVVVEPPEGLRRFIVPTGSIALNGVSLTVADLDERTFTVALIPTTLRLTNLDVLAAGHEVNLETDYLVKAVVSWMERGGAIALQPSATSAAWPASDG